jgi:hypothetical protein
MKLSTLETKIYKFWMKTIKTLRVKFNNNIVLNTGGTFTNQVNNDKIGR